MSCYLTVAECQRMQLVPYAVYGGKVYSFKHEADEVAVTAYGSQGYRDAVDEAGQPKSEQP